MVARAYLEGLKNGIDGLLKHVFAEEEDKKQEEDNRAKPED
jgi:hypothetical protein